MDIIAKVGAALQQVFGKIATSEAQASGVIQRHRCFDEHSLLKTFVLGFLQNPNASDAELCKWQCNVVLE